MLVDVALPSACCVLIIKQKLLQNLHLSSADMSLASYA